MKLTLVAFILTLACTKAAVTSSGMKISSPAFNDNQAIPKQYSCDGANISPPLQFTGIPANARSLSLVVSDPDAPGGTFTHWSVTQIPPGTVSIAEGGHVGVEGKNGFGKMGYGGPCPPSGTHHYVFTLSALDGGGAPLAQAKLTGTYKR